MLSWAGARRLPCPWAGMQHIVALVNRPSYGFGSARTSIMSWLTLEVSTCWLPTGVVQHAATHLSSRACHLWAKIYSKGWSIAAKTLGTVWFPDLLTMSTGTWKSMFHVFGGAPVCRRMLGPGCVQDLMIKILNPIINQLSWHTYHKKHLQSNFLALW